MEQAHHRISDLTLNAQNVINEIHISQYTSTAIELLRQSRLGNVSCYQNSADWGEIKKQRMHLAKAFTSIVNLYVILKQPVTVCANPIWPEYEYTALGKIMSIITSFSQLPIKKKISGHFSGSPNSQDKGLS